MSARDLPTLPASAPQTLPQTAPQWLAYNARERGATVGHRYKLRGVWKQFTWRDIHGTVERIAFGLLSLGIQPGDTVMLIGENRPEIFWAEWAAMAIGAKTVTLYPDASEPELRYIAGDSHATCTLPTTRSRSTRRWRCRRTTRA